MDAYLLLTSTNVYCQLWWNEICDSDKIKVYVSTNILYDIANVPVKSFETDILMHVEGKACM